MFRVCYISRHSAPVYIIKYDNNVLIDYPIQNDIMWIEAYRHATPVYPLFQHPADIRLAQQAVWGCRCHG